MTQKRDHGGGLDAAIAIFGGDRSDWLDLSTGINPVSYPIPNIPNYFWQDLPDSAAQEALLTAARDFWGVPKEAEIIAASGVSQLIAMMPSLQPAGTAKIISPTYNEHAAAFRANDWIVGTTGDTQVIVHPNNPDGRLCELTPADISKTDLTIIDESFCEVTPNKTLIELSKLPNVVILKGLGKFWGLAGLRLGFAVASPELVQKIRDRIGPWAVSGPAQFVGHQALSDLDWANKTRKTLSKNAAKLDQIMEQNNATIVGGTDLFRLYQVEDAISFQQKLARKNVWSRVFPYSTTWLRLGLPGTNAQWKHLLAALET